MLVNGELKCECEEKKKESENVLLHGNVEISVSAEFRL